MEKCKKCGTLQSDSRHSCVDCGAHLGRPLRGEAAAAAEEAYDDKLESMIEKTDDFYVPTRDKIMGAVCILGVVAAIVLIVLAGIGAQQIDMGIPDGVTVTQGNGGVSVISGAGTAYDYPLAQKNAMEDAALYGLIGIICLLMTCPMLLFPRFMWLLDTLKYRIFYEWDTTPSYFALVTRKIITYIIFVIGVGFVVCGYVCYFMI